ncbi:unnamed protein product [Caenorhabditis bovis]|uniref:NFX1-type zinc finger-containing protein 1 n=1 Tax=Caenorhabditis bovis TaxID=2654633 RepID=A0A8S1F093_9PELO|nr:unnamed protein product [Caenorhabditis bovis]
MDKGKYRHSIGGRILPYDPGQEKYDNDPYRGQRRRPWLTFRVGQHTVECQNKILVNYIKRVRHCFFERGFLMDEPENYLMYRIDLNDDIDDLEELERELHDALEIANTQYEPGLLSVPIGIWFSDISSDRDYNSISFLDGIFLKYSNRINFMKIEIKEVLAQIYSNRYDVLNKWCQQMIRMISEQENIPQSIAIKTPIEKRALCADLRSQQSYSKQNALRNEKKVKPGKQRPPDHKISPQDVEDALKTANITMKSLTFGKLMKNDNDLNNAWNLFLMNQRKILEEDYERCGVLQKDYDTFVMQRHSVKKYFVDSYAYYNHQNFEISEDDSENENVTSNRYFEGDYHSYTEPHVDSQIDDDEFHYESDRHHEGFSNSSSYCYRAEKQRDAYLAAYDERQRGGEIWERCELVDPKESFRKMSTIPTLKDFVNPEEPYLRRIREDGLYHSSEHYLDVQFRLLREDLVSPMRDGIDLYKRTGTHQNNRIPNTLNSDIKLYNILSIEKKQVSEKCGLWKRNAFLTPSEFQIFIESNVKMGGLVLISSDRFVNDVHLVEIEDVNEAKLMISMLMREENPKSPIEQNKGYVMAEAVSYFPSYRFVLDTMQKINPFVPLPFERYIVHGKRNIYRPFYQKQEKSEEQIKEEEMISAVYEVLRADAVERRKSEGKTAGNIDEKEQKEKPEKAGVFSCNKNKKTIKKSKENELLADDDIEGHQLLVPIHKVSFGATNAEKGNKIFIDGQLFEVSKLLDTFKPDYLDESQRVAFCNTFNRELSLIQGPPGTGKTHIAVQIVKTILLNRNNWQITTPIVVCSYTNDALDQFLQKIYEMMGDLPSDICNDEKPKMIRFGSKSRSMFLENEILSYDYIAQMMDPILAAQLIKFQSTHCDSRNIVLSPDEALACWLLDETYMEIGAKKSKYDTVPSVLVEEENRKEMNDEYEDLKASELDDELLDKILERLNLNSSTKNILDEVDKIYRETEYHTNSPWDIVTSPKMSRPKTVIMFGDNRKNRKSVSFGSVDPEIVSKIERIKIMILETPPLTNEEFSDIKDIFSLERPKRWALFMNWQCRAATAFADNLPSSVEKFRMACEEKRKAFDEHDAFFASRSLVIGATTTACSRLRNMLEIVEPNVLVVEEAAKIFEGHVFSALVPSLDHLIMIGDHEQLRPIPAVYELGTSYGLDISLFERLVERGFPYSQLQHQHRMNVDIMNVIVRPSFYPNVSDASNVYEYPAVRGMADNLYFWSHQCQESTNDKSSFINYGEVEMITELVKHLLKQAYEPSEITVLATYSAQKDVMSQMFLSIFGGTVEEPNINVATVDSFQGWENRIVILSLVRSFDANKIPGIGFLSFQKRICVALTRAQHGMYIVGNGHYLMDNSRLWKEICNNLSANNLINTFIRLKCPTHNRVMIIREPNDFQKYSPDGGCSEKCDVVKPCGHVCEKMCHPQSEAEHANPCYLKCLKTCSNAEYKHPCQKKCYEKCGSCSENVELRLDCGHRITTICSKVNGTECDQQCEKVLKCGHRCTNTCGMDCTIPEECKVVVDFRLECGHVRKIKCSDATSRNKINCVEPCQLVHVTLPCKHKISVECFKYDLDLGDEQFRNAICTTLLDKTFAPCGHHGKIRCGEMATSEKCIEECESILEKCGHQCRNECGKCYSEEKHTCHAKCEKKLPCGHNCTEICGVECAKCSAYCMTGCAHVKCGLGNNGLGRKCSELCILCTKPCGNVCPHRNCSKLCFELCDVPICNEPCSKILKNCSHVCLGMCGEVCPKICGSCNRKAYDECISMRKSGKFSRLIMLPNCEHVFPLAFLDEYVEEHINKKCYPVCPKPNCSKPINNVNRYMRIINKIVFTKNLDLSPTSNEPQVYQDSLREVQKACNILPNVNKMIQRPPKDVCIFLDSLRQLLKDLDKRVHQQLAIATSKSVANFYFDFARVLFTFAKLASFNILLHGKICLTNLPPQLDMLLKNVFGNIANLPKLFETIKFLSRYEMSGALLPTVRFEICKIVARYQLLQMISYLIETKNDISTSFDRALSSSLNAFLKESISNDFVSKLENIEQLVLREYPKISLLKWKDLKMPDF